MPRQQLTIPLLQRIALFSCKTSKDALILANVNNIFRETMIDYNTMHSVFVRRISVDSRVFDGEFFIQAVNNNVRIVLEVLIEATKWIYEDRKRTAADSNGLVRYVHHMFNPLIIVALEDNFSELALLLLSELLDPRKDFYRSAAPFVERYFRWACHYCPDPRIINLLIKSQSNGDFWGGHELLKQDYSEETLIETACQMLSSPTTSSTIEFFEILFDLVIQFISRMTGDDDSSSPSLPELLPPILATLCEYTDSPDLIRLFCDKLRECSLMKKYLPDQLVTVVARCSMRHRSSLQLAAENSHHLVLKSLLHELHRHNVLEEASKKKTNEGLTPFLFAVNSNRMKNVKLLIGNICPSQEYYEKYWLSKMVDSRGWSAVDLATTEVMKEFLTSTDCWSESRNFCLADDVEKESGKRRDREEESV